MTNVNAVIGSQYNDLLIGSDTNFSDLAGLGGNNTLVGSSEAMTNANYYEAPGAVTVNLNSVCHDGVAPGTAINGYGGTDTLIDISGIDGSQVSDIIYAGTISAENFNGNGGNDVVSYESFTGVIDVFFNSSVVVVPNPDLPDLNITDNLSNIQAVEINGSAFGLLEEDIIQGGSSAYVTTGQTLILGGTGSIYLTDENFSSVQNISDLKVGSSVDLFSLYAGSGTSLFNEGMGVNTIDLSGMGAGSSATVDLTNDFERHDRDRRTGQRHADRQWGECRQLDAERHRHRSQRCRDLQLQRVPHDRDGLLAAARRERAEHLLQSQLRQHRPHRHPARLDRRDHR